MFLSSQQLALAPAAGEVQLVDVATGARTPLATGGPITQLEARGGTDGWVLVRRADNSLWRHHLATHTTTTLPAQAAPRWQVLAHDGTACIAEGTEVSAWRPDGTVVHHAHLEVAAHMFAQLLDDTRLLVGTADVGAVIVRLDRPDEVIERFPAGSRMYDWAWSGDLWISRDVGGTVAIADLSTTVTYPLAHPTRAPFVFPGLTPDAARASALVDGRIAVWELGVPTTAAATQQLLEALTSAHTVPGRRALQWTP